MRPVYLEFCGINSFSEPAKIDFSDLLEYGIFGIFGDTGSGKSTVLDCIGFALYGNVARSRSGSIADIINYKLDSAYVKFEFEIVYEGRRRTFRVERELRRKNASQTVHVYERTGADTLATLSDGCRDSNALLERIIGLEQRDFERCIALPQGEFAQFVKAARAERLKLVSRLFGLEAYGEQLVKRVNREYAEAARQRDVAQARLEPYAAFSEEGNAALAEEIGRLLEEEKAARARLDALRAEEQRLDRLCRLKAEAEKNEAELAALEEKRTEMEELEGEPSRLEKAAAALAVAEEGRALRMRSERERAAYDEASARLEAAKKAAEESASWDEEAAEREIERLSELCKVASSAEEVRSAKRRGEARLEETVRSLREEKGLFPDFSYDGRKAALESRLAALGSADPFEYALSRGKEVFLSDAYTAFAGELGVLTKKYPEIGADTAPMIASYEKKAAEGEEGRDALHSGFEEAVKERERINSELIALEKQKNRYDMHLQRLQQLGTEFNRLKGEIADCEARLRGAPDLKETEAAFAALMREKRIKGERKAKARDALSAATAAEAAAKERALAADAALTDCRKRYSAALEAGGFSSAEEAKALTAKHGDPQRARRVLGDYRDRYAAALARKREYDGMDLTSVTAEAAKATSALRLEEEKALGELTGRIAVSGDTLERGKKALAEKRVLERELSQSAARCKLFGQLRSMLEGNKFMEYVAEEYLQTIAGNAGSRLLSLTDGRYFLRYDGGFYVGDNFNGGERRAVYTLSGGETFLVSLSLALALGEEICARSLRPIEFFFLDEGFGTLDSHLVDTVMDSLEKLRGEHFSIGIISHVEELKHRIDRKLSVVKATEKHGSEIIVE